MHEDSADLVPDANHMQKIRVTKVACSELGRPLFAKRASDSCVPQDGLSNYGLEGAAKQSSEHIIFQEAQSNSNYQRPKIQIASQSSHSKKSENGQKVEPDVLTPVFLNIEPTGQLPNSAAARQAFGLGTPTLRTMLAQKLLQRGDLANSTNHLTLNNQDGGNQLPGSLMPP